jgi:hypothetical protein
MPILSTSAGVRLPTSAQTSIKYYCDPALSLSWSCDGPTKSPIIATTRRVRQSSSTPSHSPTGRAPARLDPRWSPSLRSTLVPRPSPSSPLVPPPPVGNDAASAARPPTGGPASLLRSKIRLALRGVPAPLARRLLQIPASGLPPTLSFHPALPRRDLWDSASPPHAPSWPAPPLPKDASSYWCRSRQPTSSASASKSSTATSSYSARSSRGAPKASE